MDPSVLLASGERRAWVNNVLPNPAYSLAVSLLCVTHSKPVTNAFSQAWLKNTVLQWIFFVLNASVCCRTFISIRIPDVKPGI